MKSEIVLALDVDNINKAKYFVRKLYPKVKTFKVGSQLFTSCGPEIIKFIKKHGGEVFLDLKFFDIPNTVANAVRSAVHLEVKMLTLHIAGGEEMLKSSVKAAADEAKRVNVKRPLLIGVTVLTSRESGLGEIIRLAKLGITCGLDGVVCSVREAVTLRKQIKKKFSIVTPGIRPNGSCCDDQKRTATVHEAVKAGSNFLVIGRPILKAADPLKAVKGLL